MIARLGRARLGGIGGIRHTGRDRRPERPHVRAALAEALLHRGVDLRDHDVVGRARDQVQGQILGVRVRLSRRDRRGHGGEDRTPVQVGLLIGRIRGINHERGARLFHAVGIELVGGDQGLGGAQLLEVEQILHARLAQDVVLQCELRQVAEVGLDHLRAENPVDLGGPLGVHDLVHVRGRRDGGDALEFQAGLRLQRCCLDPRPHRSVPALAMAHRDEVVAAAHAWPALGRVGRGLQSFRCVEQVACFLRAEDVGLLVTGLAVDGDAEVVGHDHHVALGQHLVEEEADVEQVDVHAAGTHGAVAHRDRGGAARDGALVRLAQRRVRPCHHGRVRCDVLRNHDHGRRGHCARVNAAAAGGVRNPALVGVHDPVLLARNLAVGARDVGVGHAGRRPGRGVPDLRHDQILCGLQRILDRQLRVGQRELLGLDDHARVGRQLQWHVVERISGRGEREALLA